MYPQVDPDADAVGLVKRTDATRCGRLAKRRCRAEVQERRNASVNMDPRRGRMAPPHARCDSYTYARYLKRY